MRGDREQLPALTPCDANSGEKLQSDAALGRCRDRAGGEGGGGGLTIGWARHKDWLIFKNIKNYSCLLRHQCSLWHSVEVHISPWRLFRPRGQRSLVMMISGQVPVRACNPSPLTLPLTGVVSSLCWLRIAAPLSMTEIEI